MTYQGGELGIVAHNSTLADVLRAVRKLTGADMEIPPNATERVVADIGPGPARDVLAELLNGTHFNYVMVGSTTDPTAVQSIVLTAKSSASETASVAAPNRPGVPPRGLPRAFTRLPEHSRAPRRKLQPGRTWRIPRTTQRTRLTQPMPPEDQAQSQNQDQQNPAQQQTPKTPEQLLQELQRQQQLQQQQQQPQPTGTAAFGTDPKSAPHAGPKSQKPD